MLTVIPVGSYVTAAAAVGRREFSGGSDASAEGGRCQRPWKVVTVRGQPNKSVVPLQSNLDLGRSQFRPELSSLKS